MQKWKLFDEYLFGELGDLKLRVIGWWIKLNKEDVPFKCSFDENKGVFDLP